MSAVAVPLTIILFFAFLASGLQKVIFNPTMSRSADHLGFTKSAYQRVGGLEIAGALGLLVGVAAWGSSFWAIVNEAAAIGLFVLMVRAALTQFRKGDKADTVAPVLVLGVLALLELVFRLAH
ncbi:MAG TPA: DoxX family protein [Acidimicrobiales bacterium]